MTDSRTASAILRRLENAWRFARSIWRKLTDDDVLFLASGLAFNGILTLLPMLLLSVAVGSILNSYTASLNQLNDILDAVFPQQPFTGQIKASIVTLISNISAYRRSFGLLGIVVLLWTITSIFDAIRSALHRIYELKRTRGLFASIVHEFGFIMLAFFLFVATNFALWAYSLLTPRARNVPLLKSLIDAGLARVVPTVIIVVLAAVMFYIVYGYITDVKPPRAAAIISTLTTTVLWIIAGRLFAVYFTQWSNIGEIYGPYAFLLVLLLWIYISSFLFVFGGIVGQVYWERKKLEQAGVLKRKV